MSPGTPGERVVTNLDKKQIRIDEPRYPNPALEQRDFLERLGWTMAAVGLIILIVAVAVVVW